MHNLVLTHSFLHWDPSVSFTSLKLPCHLKKVSFSLVTVVERKKQAPSIIGWTLLGTQVIPKHLPPASSLYLTTDHVDKQNSLSLVSGGHLEEDYHIHSLKLPPQPNVKKRNTLYSNVLKILKDPEFGSIEGQWESSTTNLQAQRPLPGSS